MEGTGSRATNDPKAGAGTEVAAEAGSSGGAQGRAVEGQGAVAVGAYPTALCTRRTRGVVGGRGASARPGRERRGRCDAGGAADWLILGLAPPLPTPQSPAYI